MNSTIDLSKYQNPDDQESIDIEKYGGKEIPQQTKKQLPIKPGFEKLAPILKLMSESPSSMPGLLSDVATGLGRAGQNLASTLSGGKTPRYNIEKSFGAERGNPITQVAAQYALPGPLGGGKLLQTMLSAGGYGALQHQPGDETIFTALPQNRLTAGIEQAGLSALPFGIKPAKKLISSLISPAIHGNPTLVAERAATKQSILGKQKTLEEVAKEHQAQLQSEKQAITQSEIETGKAKPSTMRHNVSEGENVLAEKQKEISDLNKQLEEHKKLPELPEINTANHEKNLANANKALEDSTKHLEETKLAHETAKNQLSNAENNIGNFLRSGSPHDEVIASRIKPTLERLEKEIPKEYAEVVEEAKNMPVDVPQEAMKDYLLSSKDYGQLLAGSRKLHLPGSMIKSTGNEFLDDILSYAPKSTDTNVGVFMDRVKDLREMIHNTNRAIEIEPIASRRTQMSHAVKEAKKVLEAAKNTLDQSLGDLSPRWKEVNKKYAEVLWPLRENKIAQKVLENTTMPDNVIKAIRGSDKGNVLLRNMIQSDPDALIHTVGQRYDAAPKKFYGKNTRLKEYSDKIPGFNNVIDQRKNALSNIEKTESNIKSSEKRNAEIKQYHKEAKSELKTKQSEQKLLEKEKTERIEKEQSIKEKTVSLNKEIREKQVKLDKIKKHIDLLENESKKTKLSQSRVNDIKNEIKQERIKLKSLSTDVEKSKSRLFKLARSGYRVSKGIIRGLHKLGK